MLNYKTTFRCLYLTFLSLTLPAVQRSLAQTPQIDGFAIPRLSPKPYKLDGNITPQLSLNGQWDFSTENSGQKKAIAVPGEWEMQGFSVSEGQTAYYTRNFNIPADWTGKRIKIRFDGVSSHARILVNGIEISSHEGSFVSFEADITKAVKAGANKIEVQVQALTVSDRLACTSQYAVHTVGGILRDVTLLCLPETNIANLTINTQFDKDYKNAWLELNPTIVSEGGSAPSDIQLQYILKDNQGKRVLDKSFAIKAGMTSPPQKVLVNKPFQWNPESPYLYTLETVLKINGQAAEVLRQKVGFRDVKVSGNKVLVNGQSIKLKGVCRHSVQPLTGRSISAELERQDAELFKRANCNFIRTSHYPPTEAFLNACDSVGLFVESESSLCWIQHHASPIWRLWNYEDPTFLPFMVNANIEKMIAQRNHPSIIMWSLGNESRWSTLWAKVNKVVKQLDPHRPTVFHDQCWGGFNNAKSQADIANYHYPGINGPSACDTMKRPVLFGEYAHLSCYNRRELITDPGIREAYGQPLVQMYDEMNKHDGCLGGAIWSGIDDTFLMPDGRTVGYGPWGPLDGWRRPKPEYYGMQMAYAPVKILNVENQASTRGIITLTIQNRYDFTDLKDIAIRVEIDGRTSSQKLALKPHAIGKLVISVPRTAESAMISFAGVRGSWTNQHLVTLRARDIKKDIEKVGLQVSENAAAYLVNQGKVTYLISKTNGLITKATSNGNLILTNGPVPAIIDANSEDGGKPNVAGETYQDNISPLKDYPLYTLFAKDLQMAKSADSITLKMKVSYNGDIKGDLSYIFLNDGRVKVQYALQYNAGSRNVRQYGLLMQLPSSFDKLTWDRKGFFSVYPKDDIGRNQGSAMLNARRSVSVEQWRSQPDQPWKDDAMEYGSNDFRSTKSNVITASLTDKNSHGVEILSDGTQATRSWKQDGAIQFLIADYSNNGSEPFYGSPFADRLDISKKKLTGQIVFRIF